MRFNRKIACGILLGAVLITIGIIIIRIQDSYVTALQKNWGLSVPQNIEVLYERDEGNSIFGDGCRYHVLECDLTNSSSAITLKPYGEITSSERSGISDILNLLEIPDTKRPKSINLYYHAVSGQVSAPDEIYLLADSGNKLVYVIESFY